MNFKFKIQLLLLVSIIASSCTMKSKIFTSPAGWFSLTLPADWNEYDDGEEGTFAFFNSNNWTGNFRVTPFRWKNVVDSSVDKVAEYIDNELLENYGAKRIKLGDLTCAHYKKDISQEGDELIVYYWVTGERNSLFLCSLTIDKGQEQMPKNQIAIREAEQMIKSIKIH